MSEVLNRGYLVVEKLIFKVGFRLFSIQMNIMLILGQMYLNGRQNLGFVIKSNTYHLWPKNVKDFLQIGTEVLIHRF